jgi:glycosyltransferase involved in cell wall biosynthesis
VIVAVYNPGPHFDDLIASFLRQTMPADDFEVLLCDDGSDPQTQERLDAVAAEHSHLKVLKLEHSGWPGTPRNHGIDQAKGEYVFFCDHDDRLGDQALQRMADYADQNRSDVLVGKLVGVGRSLPRGMFRRNIPDAKLGTDPLLEILTPHKLFRTSFIREHGIRFPDGRVRLEDHMFVMKAYFAASVISILADYPCYYWTQRQDKPSASATRIEPGPYFHYLGAVLDIVEANTEPGEFRDSLMQHWYRGKVIKRLGGRQLIRYSPEYLESFLAAVRPLVRDRFGPQLDRYMLFPMRLCSSLLRADRIDGLLALARVDVGISAAARVTALRWEGGRLRLEIEAQVRYPDGTPLEFAPDPAIPGSLVWQLPEPIEPDVLTPAVLDAAPDIAGDRVELLLRDRHDQADYQQDGEADGLRTVVALDPRTARAGRAVTRNSDLIVQLRRAGWNFSTHLRVDAEVLAAAGALDCVVGKRVLNVATRGGDRLVLQARKRPTPPKGPESVTATAPTAVVRTRRRVLGLATNVWHRLPAPVRAAMMPVGRRLRRRLR